MSNQWNGWWVASDGNWYPPQSAPWGAAPRPAPPTFNPLAIVSLVCSVTFCGPGSIAAVITGHMAKRQIRESGGLQKGDELATAGLVIGYIGFAFMLLWLPLQFGVFFLA